MRDTVQWAASCIDHVKTLPTDSIQHRPDDRDHLGKEMLVLLVGILGSSPSIRSSSACSADLLIGGIGISHDESNPPPWTRTLELYRTTMRIVGKGSSFMLQQHLHTTLPLLKLRATPQPCLRCPHLDGAVWYGVRPEG